MRSGFLHPEKIHRPQPDVNPRTLDLETSTLPRGRLVHFKSTLYFLILMGVLLQTLNSIMTGGNTNHVNTELLAYLVRLREEDSKPQVKWQH